MNCAPSILVAIPAHNEEKYIDRVLPRVLQFQLPVMVVDDGSTDSTAARAAKWPVELVRNPKNSGYGRVMQDIFAWSTMRGFDCADELGDKRRLVLLIAVHGDDPVESTNRRPGEDVLHDSAIAGILRLSHQFNRPFCSTGGG